MDSKNEVHIDVSRHAERRLRERLGINRRAAKRLAEKAFYEGVRHKDTCGRLKKWMSGLYKKNRKANNMRIYGDFLYIFCDHILVTVFIVPNDMRQLIRASQNDD